VPPNGLVIYCGTIVTEEGKEKKVNIDFEPFKPINTSLYLCDNKVRFHVILSQTYQYSYTKHHFYMKHTMFYSFTQKHLQHYLLMIINLVSLSWMVMEPYLARYKGTRVKYYINSPWIFPRSMVYTVLKSEKNKRI
jgi:hypothetical protein